MPQRALAPARLSNAANAKQAAAAVAMPLTNTAAVGRLPADDDTMAKLIQLSCSGVKLAMASYEVGTSPPESQIH